MRYNYKYNDFVRILKYHEDHMNASGRVERVTSNGVYVSNHEGTLTNDFFTFEEVRFMPKRISGFKEILDLLVAGKVIKGINDSEVVYFFEKESDLFIVVNDEIDKIIFPYGELGEYDRYYLMPDDWYESDNKLIESKLLDTDIIEPMPVKKLDHMFTAMKSGFTIKVLKEKFKPETFHQDKKGQIIHRLGEVSANLVVSYPFRELEAGRYDLYFIMPKEESEAKPMSKIFNASDARELADKSSNEMTELQIDSALMEIANLATEYKYEAIFEERKLGLYARKELVKRGFTVEHNGYDRSLSYWKVSW